MFSSQTPQCWDKDMSQQGGPPASDSTRVRVTARGDERGRRFDVVSGGGSVPPARSVPGSVAWNCAAATPLCAPLCGRECWTLSPWRALKSELSGARGGHTASSFPRTQEIGRSSSRAGGRACEAPWGQARSQGRSRGHALRAFCATEMPKLGTQARKRRREKHFPDVTVNRTFHTSSLILGDSHTIPRA